MNKKYFSVLLMGALAVASMGTITSCKDYDDDISGLQQQIDELSKAVKDIQTQIANGAILTSVTPVENGIKITLNQNGVSTPYTITNGKDGATGATGAPGKDGVSWKIGGNGNWWSNDGSGYKDSGLPSRGEKGEQGETGAAGAAGKNGAYYVPNAETGKFDKYQDGKKVESTDIEYLAPGTITAVWENNVLTLNNVKGATDNKVVISLNSQLRSLVFSPTHFIDGVEAIDLGTYKYQPLVVEKVDADKDYSKDAPKDAAEALLTYAPDVNAAYFLNPSNAAVTEDAKDYKFVVNNATYTSTRAASNPIFNIEKVSNYKGVVDVHAKYSGEALKQLNLSQGKNDMTLVALRYTKDNVSVTSDFATLNTSEYTDVELHNAKSVNDDQRARLNGSAASAIVRNYGTVKDETPLALVKYDDPVGIDLREYVKTYWVSNGKFVSVEKKNATEDAVKKDGFKYTFELVGYKAGNNQTSQSAHAAIAANGYTLRAQGVDSEGKQMKYGEGAQTRANIDKEPLVRVVLNDTVNNKVVAVGYLKVKIVEKLVEPNPTFISKEFTDNTAFTLNCDDNKPALDKKIAWHEVENQILADEQVNMSKAEFESTYVLDGNAKNLTQYSNNTLNAPVQKTNIGVVSVTTKDFMGTMTEVLEWTVSGQQAYSIFKNEGVKEISTYVRYTLRDGKTAPNKYIYVKFTWTPSQINIKPETTFSNTNKIKQSWYAQNNLTAGTGFDEIHGNVEQIGMPGAKDNFKFDIKASLVENKITLSKMDKPYNVLDHVVAGQAYFTFVEGHGFAVSNANGYSVLTYEAADKKSYIVATMTKDGIVTMAKTVPALELLNAYGPDQLAKVLTARVAVKSATCWDAPITINNNTFDVKFIRPITVSDASASFVDATESVADVNLTFKNWNGYDFTNPKRPEASKSYFAYYGVKSIKLLTNEATTDLNGVDGQKLSQVTSKIKLAYTAPTESPIVAKKYGKLTYYNNGLTVGDFTITIPAEITYDWGTLKTNVKVTVKKSQVATVAKK